MFEVVLIIIKTMLQLKMNQSFDHFVECVAIKVSTFIAIKRNLLFRYEMKVCYCVIKFQTQRDHIKRWAKQWFQMQKTYLLRWLFSLCWSLLLLPSQFCWAIMFDANCNIVEMRCSKQRKHSKRSKNQINEKRRRNHVEDNKIASN